MISFELDEAQALFAKTASDFARDRFRPAARSAEADGRAADALTAEYTSLGFGALDLPEVIGGLGQGLATRAVVEEALAFGDLGLTLAMPNPGPFADALLALGNDDDRQRHLAPLVEAGRRGGLLWSEVKPRARTFSTVAREVDGGYAIFGRKAHAVAAREVASFVVFARMERKDGEVRPAAFVVPADADGVRVGEPIRGLGLQAAPTCEVTLEDVVVDADHRLAAADEDFDGRVVTMWSRIAIVAAARSVGLASAAFEYARAYAAEREAFGKPIAHFQGLAFLIADMATRVEVMRALVMRAAWAFDTNAKDRTKYAAMAAAECHEGAMFVANQGVQVLGGAGFVRDHLSEKWMRDARAHMAYGIPYALADLIVGRRALGESDANLQEDAPMPELQPVMA
ncbi:MAG: acyl-CoA dehydrogenase family protein [Deltaproteobacteria bacterium]